MNKRRLGSLRYKNLQSKFFLAPLYDYSIVIRGGVLLRTLPEYGYDSNSHKSV